MKINLRTIYLILLLCLVSATASAQRFYNLTAREVRVDSVVPVFTHTESLPAAYSDSVYTFDIVYPEYAEMPSADVANYKRIAAALPPRVPHVSTDIVYDRKKASISASFSPVVYRDGRYQVLASFMLRRTARPKQSLKSRAGDDSGSTSPASRYAAHSVLSSGRWAKIRVAESGVHQLTDAVVRQAGFSDPSRVRVYGYGGNLQNEVLTADDLVADDDLRPVPMCMIGGRRLFHALGPVSWESNGATRRTRNPYSDYGYYFITEGDSPTEYVDSAAFVGSFYPSADDYHDLYEVDGHYYVQCGRNLYDTRSVAVGDSLALSFDSFEGAGGGKLSVSITSDAPSTVDVVFNGKVLGSLRISSSASEYVKGFQTTGTYPVDVDPSKTSQSLVLRVTGNGPMRLDYASMAWNNPRPLPNLATASLPAAQYVYNITNQDHHADPQADMVIIIPTSQKLRAQAERLKKFHEERDSMSVNIVPADEIYNEFSSGTPDASAYRHYLKMLYDRATSEAEQPRFLLLFGGSVWDNRMKSSACRQLSVDDYLLAYETENSFDKRYSCVDDGFYCMLDDGEGGRPVYADKIDVAVGRFPVTTESDAKTMVDKMIQYADGNTWDSWLNTVLFMGDDGDNNTHMNGANNVADELIASHPGYHVRKVMWDAYERESTASGYAYPEVSRIIKQQQQHGALVMDYVGHGSEWQFSHENVLHMSDFKEFSNQNLPLWVTIGCDFMPFDRLEENIGMDAVLNSKGGAVAFVGSMRTVFSTSNAVFHRALMRQLFSKADDGGVMTVGDAVRRAKNECPASDQSLAANSRQFALLGDPALKLNMPTASIVIDSICGKSVADDQAMAQMKAGALVSVVGHVADMPAFDGKVTLAVFDNMEQVTCRDNAGDVDTPFVYADRTKTIYNGSNNVKDGRFSFTFAVPKDINYSNETGLITAWAVNNDRSVIAQGYSEKFLVGDSQLAANDSIGPSIYCYLNSPSFQNGGNVNSTPYFVAEITDRDGINASGAGIGHDLQLCIDGKQELTYSLNDNFTFDFGSYTTGSTYYNIPELSEGEHRLQFRAWDIQNNVSTAELVFNVVKGQKPSFTISCTDNPASESTTFIIAHDRTGCAVDVTVEVFDLSGRLLWSHSESGTSADSVYTVNWDLTADNGGNLGTGVYLYRVKLGSDGAVRTSKAKKLVIVGNK